MLPSLPHVLFCYTLDTGWDLLSLRALHRGEDDLHFRLDVTESVYAASGQFAFQRTDSGK